MVEPTAGEWELGGEIETGLWITGPDHAAPVLCDIVPRSGLLDGPATEEDLANAQIMSAGKEMLAALEAALPNLEWANIHGSRCEQLLSKVHRAIAKATGNR